MSLVTVVDLADRLSANRSKRCMKRWSISRKAGGTPFSGRYCRANRSIVWQTGNFKGGVEGGFRCQAKSRLPYGVLMGAIWR